MKVLEKISGIDDSLAFDLLADTVTVRILLTYPDYQDLLTLAPPVRMQSIRQRQRDTYNDFTQGLTLPFERIGKHMSPNGVIVTCRKSHLSKFSEDSRIDTIEIIAGNEALPKPPTTSRYFTVQVRFAIQIEGKTRGNQTYEDRFLMIQAFDESDAKTKLKASFAEYEAPYLNGKGQQVRWQFEAFIDYYEMYYDSQQELLADANTGIEVFSRLQNRRITAAQIWNPALK